MIKNNIYCTSNDFIPLDNGYYYLENDRTIYLKGTGQNYKPVKQLEQPLKVKVTNKEFNHRVVLNNPLMVAV